MQRVPFQLQQLCTRCYLCGLVCTPCAAGVCALLSHQRALRECDTVCVDVWLATASCVYNQIDGVTPPAVVEVTSGFSGVIREDPLPLLTMKKTPHTCNITGCCSSHRGPV